MIFSIGITNDLDNKLSTHRSDYEIHTPEHRATAKRPQSTAELVSLVLNRFDYFQDCFFYVQCTFSLSCL